MEELELKDGIVKLSGFCEATFYVGWNNDEPVDGFVIQIDGVNYAAYEDPDDGYRSYGSFHKTDKPCTNTFPPQEVLLERVKEEGKNGLDEEPEPEREMLYLANPVTKEVILEVGTTWYDSYYPMGRCFFNPAAMPINKNNKYENMTLTIIAEWNRSCGDHVIIGKTTDGEYLEGIISEEELQFGPITDFKYLN